MQYQVHGIRALAAVGAVSFLSLFGALQNYGDTDQKAAASKDLYFVMTRMNALGASLPEIPIGARVGYFTDAPEGTVAGSAAFFATQYAVAPRILVEGKRAQDAVWWLGGFSKQLDFRAEGAARGLTFVRELGGGMALFRKDVR